MTLETPSRWRSVLPHLAEPLPPDVTPPRASGDVKINIPVELIRHSVSTREYWDIPAPVVERYRQYRPTPLWRARGFEEAVDARVPIYVKNEGGNISGSHKLNTALAQAHYYKAAGVEELVTGTGAGQWGTALAAACALFGLRCRVFMVDSSLQRKPYRGVLMRMLGAELHSSPSGLTKVAAKEDLAAGNSLSLAIGEAVEYAADNDGVAFCIGSGETYSILHQSVIGLEAAEQLAALDAPVGTVIGCVGAGSNFGGIALPFHAAARTAGTEGPRLVAAESSSTPKLTRGVYAYDKTDATGSGPMEAMYTIGSDYQIPDAHTAGLRFHGAAKVISAMRHSGDIDAMAVSQADALDAGRLLARHESVLPAPESGHALAAAARIAASPDARQGVLVCVSGHGYLDLAAYEHFLDGGVEDQSPSDEALAHAVSGLATVAVRT
ncbi:TrpB-like pyridoxal phosphate-dependent enzyme [Streptomyces candidus]|uniref:tryptophan synthase n=1 Tax=Streptomyces candidus TaxID=67283 RepID=A0A7X0HM14_9ACTN|nr:TrpB-like pyridoxal phosphate-dependent enzyme [Streptomyces candidus]MBB6438623.1 tryptophan synthase beta chain [Streptomyces candidus]GHH45280.1 tryptophan synthase beta chain [Streptomyces candidus]